MSVLIKVSYGELIDKLTILEIKASRITDPAKLMNITTELTLLEDVYLAHAKSMRAIGKLRKQLYQINLILWGIEDKIRDKERNKTFDAGFVELARSVYLVNDQRSEIKRKINEALGSLITEEKSYTRY